MIEEFAAIYVNYLVPTGRAILVFLVILTVLWLLVVINDAKKGKELIHNLFQWIWQAVYGAAKFIAMGVWWLLLFVWRTVNIIFTAIRDFFISSV